MMKSVNKKLFPIFGVILLVACTDPDAEIKELNTNQLNDVIDTLYIENNKGEATSQNITENTSTDESVKDIDKDTPSSNVIENQVVGNNSTIEQAPVEETSSASSAQTSDTASVVEETPQINEPEESNTQSSNNTSEPNSDDTLTESEEVVSNPTTEQISSTGFSEPTTQSETTSDIVLKELLAKYSAIDYSKPSNDPNETQAIETYCKAISGRLSSVSMKGCLASNHRISPFKTVNGQPIVVTEFAPKPEREPLGKILVIGGTHGDELTSVSTAYKWISNLNRFHSGLFHWHIAPALNADGVLKRPATRPNATGVDINRNLPTPDWDKQSVLRWEKLSKNARKNPGASAASEPETQWIMHEIATFQPDAIVSIHAPYGILDFDSPQLNNAPKNFGRLQLNLLGTYPGSLGNYAGIQRKIPVLTLELPNATSMPSQKELAAIWGDMIKWLRVQLSSS